MKFKYFLLLLTVSVSLIAWAVIEARGGGRGGGGGGGGPRGGGARSSGGSRGPTGNSYSRTPSLSRANLNRPASQDRKAPQPLRNQGQANAPQRRIDAQQAIQRNPARTVRNPAGTNAQQFRSTYSNVRTSQTHAANNVRDGIRTNHSNYRDYFGNNFNNRFNYHPNWYTPGYNAWARSNWPYVNSWLGWGWSDPYYYDNEGSYYEVPAEYYTDDATTSQSATQGNWLTLGVFAVSQNEQNANYTNMFVQLVVDKNGVLSGTYYNAASDKIHPLDGFIDKDTQQAVWRVADNIDSPIMTTGIYNLTADVADVKARYSNGNEQFWKLIRLQ